MRCDRCHRKLTREPVNLAGLSLGPKCAAAVTGAKAKRIRVERHPGFDERQWELFVEGCA